MCALITQWYSADVVVFWGIAGYVLASEEYTAGSCCCSTDGSQTKIQAQQPQGSDLPQQYIDTIPM